jgi:hypothetical protein
MLAAPRHSVRRTPKEQIRHQSQDSCHDHSFLGIKPAKFDDLVNEVNDDGNDKDLGNVFPAFMEQISPIVRIAENDPAIRDAVLPASFHPARSAKKAAAVGWRTSRKVSGPPIRPIRFTHKQALRPKVSQSVENCAVVALPAALGESKSSLQSSPLPMRLSISNNAKWIENTRRIPSAHESNRYKLAWPIKYRIAPSKSCSRRDASTYRTR